VGLALFSLAGQSTRRLAILVLIDAAALNARCCFNTFAERLLLAYSVEKPGVDPSDFAIVFLSRPLCSG
jgi:hypothetical protein